MKIKSNKLVEDLKNNKAIRIELGAGNERKSGTYALDYIDLDDIDVVADLNKPLDLLPDNSCEYVYSHHAFEHIDNFLLLMQEVHRITKNDGEVEIVVPHFSNIFGFSDPTHVRFFGLYTMYYFVDQKDQPKNRKVPAFYTNTRFKIKSIKIEFYNISLFDKLLSRLFYKLVNINFATQMFYERRLSFIYHARQIRYILSPVKS